MMDSKSNAVWAAGAVVVLMGAFALGWGIRQVRMSAPEAESKVEAEKAPEQVSAGSAAIKETYTPVVAVIEEEAAVEEEGEEEVEEANEAIAEAVEEEETVEAASGAEQSSGMRGMGGWQQMLANLNLTEEEKARLQEGFRLMRERWANMSEEERESERARMRGMWERWQGMSDEERQETMGRLRDQFEDWRRSGDVELPRFELD